MANFKLNLIPGMNRLEEASNLVRKYQNLRSNAFNAIITLHNLRSLELTGFVVALNDLFNGLSELKMLESLRFENVLLDDESKRKRSLPVELSKLKRLALIMSDFQIIGLIATTALDSFSVQTSLIASMDSDLLVNLLSQQHSLENLEVYGGVVNPLLNNERVCKLPFKLNRFAIGKSSLHESSNNLQSFLHVHQETLTDLTVESALPVPLQVFIFKNLKKLTALQAPITRKLNYLQRQSGDTSTEPFPNMQRFVADNLTDPSFMKSLKSIVALDMTSVAQARSWSDSGALCQLFNLRELHVSQFFLLFPITFVNLKEFHIHRTVPDNFFENFLRSHCDTLEKLTIGWIDASAFSRGTLVDTVNSCTKLKHISFTSDSPIVIRSFSKIKRSFPWTLEAKFFTLRKSENVEVRVAFKFPDDEAVWQCRCHTWDDLLVRDFDSFDNYGLNAYVNKFK